MQFGQLATQGGYLNSECTSAMQKCIRRGLEEEALFWATELDLPACAVRRRLLFFALCSDDHVNQGALKSGPVRRKTTSS
jgi:hypothetical protein